MVTHAKYEPLYPPKRRTVVSCLLIHSTYVTPIHFFNSKLFKDLVKIFHTRTVVKKICNINIHSNFKQTYESIYCTRMIGYKIKMIITMYAFIMITVTVLM